MLPASDDDLYHFGTDAVIRPTSRITDASYRTRSSVPPFRLFFFFHDTPTTEIYPLSLHDALPISRPTAAARCWFRTRNGAAPVPPTCLRCRARDRKSTRLNSSHVEISYAVFC